MSCLGLNGPAWGVFCRTLTINMITTGGPRIFFRFGYQKWHKPNLGLFSLEGWWCSRGHWMGPIFWRVQTWFWNGNFGKGFALQDEWSSGWGLMNPVDIQMSHSNWGGFWMVFGMPEKHMIQNTVYLNFCYDGMPIGNGIHHQSIAILRVPFSQTHFLTLDMIDRGYRLLIGDDGIFIP